MNELSCLHGSEGYGACDDEAHQRGRERRERSSGQERHSGKAAKTTAIFKPCENSEEPAVFVPFPISISDAPDSEHSMPFRVSFHRTTKSQAEQQKR